MSDAYRGRKIRVALALAAGSSAGWPLAKWRALQLKKLTIALRTSPYPRYMCMCMCMYMYIMSTHGNQPQINDQVFSAASLLWCSCPHCAPACDAGRQSLGQALGTTKPRSAALRMVPGGCRRRPARPCLLGATELRGLHSLPFFAARFGARWTNSAPCVQPPTARKRRGRPRHRV